MDTSIPVAASAVLHAGRYRIAQHSEDAAHGPSSGSHRLCYSCKWPLAAPWLDVHQAGGRNRRRSCCVAQKIGHRIASRTESPSRRAVRASRPDWISYPESPDEYSLVRARHAVGIGV